MIERHLVDPSHTASSFSKRRTSVSRRPTIRDVAHPRRTKPLRSAKMGAILVHSFSSSSVQPHLMAGQADPRAVQRDRLAGPGRAAPRGSAGAGRRGSTAAATVRGRCPADRHCRHGSLPVLSAGSLQLQPRPAARHGECTAAVCDRHQAVRHELRSRTESARSRANADSSTKHGAISSIAASAASRSPYPHGHRAARSVPVSGACDPARAGRGMPPPIILCSVVSRRTKRSPPTPRSGGPARVERAPPSPGRLEGRPGTRGGRPARPRRETGGPAATG